MHRRDDPRELARACAPGAPLERIAYFAPVSREAFYAIACDPARSVAVEACAGAGKTWMLVSRIVRALLEGAAEVFKLAEENFGPLKARPLPPRKPSGRRQRKAARLDGLHKGRNALETFSRFESIQFAPLALHIDSRHTSKRNFCPHRL